MVKVSDGKTRPTPMRLHLSMEILKLQKEESSPPNHNIRQTPSDSRVGNLNMPLFLSKHVYSIIVKSVVDADR